MSGGGGSKYKAPPPAQMKPVPQADLQTTGWGGMGYQQVPQTYTAQGKPSWMQGVWDMPSWGTDAATGQALTQQMLQPQVPAQAQKAPQQTQQPQQQGPNLYTMGMMYNMMRDNPNNTSEGLNQMTDLRNRIRSTARGEDWFGRNERRRAFNLQNRTWAAD